jgi:serine protease Do
MRYYKYSLFGVIVTAVVLFTGVDYATSRQPTTVSENAVVKVTLANCHGSGVNIGDGFIVTAAHVAGDATTVKIKTSTGKEVDADVLWINKTYDLALLRTADMIGKGTHIDCRTAKAGETIQAAGNPLDLEFVSSFGRIAGDVREIGPWKEALVTDITTVMGQSGGPVFEADGRVIGITVGVFAAPLKGGKDAAGADIYTPTMTGFGMVVPSSAICRLLAREV